jgi:tryptophan synthase alpha chain
VTGAGTTIRDETLRAVAALRAQVAVPVAVGFGVSTPEHAARIARVADGVIVGSALIDALDSGGEGAAADLIASMRSAMDVATAGTRAVHESPAG